MAKAVRRVVDVPIQFVKSTTDLVEATSVLTAAGTTLVLRLKEFSDVTSSALDDTLAKYNSLKYKAVECKISLITLRNKLNDATVEANGYVMCVIDLYCCGRDEGRIMRIKEGIERGNIGELSDFICQLQGLLGECRQSYHTANKSFREVRSHSLELAGVCKKKGEEVKAKKYAARAIGGTAATVALVGGVGGGVALSVVAGVFTFGIGTVVGLSLTAAGAFVAAPAVAVGTGVATYCISEHFEESENSFKELSCSFDNLQSSASHMLNYVHNLDLYVKCISRNMVNPFRNSKDKQVIISALDYLYQYFGESQERPCAFRERLIATQKEIQTRVDEILA